MEHDLFLRLDVIEGKLDNLLVLTTTQSTQLLTKLSTLQAMLTNLRGIIVKELDDLQAQVTTINTVEDSAIALLNGLSAQLTIAAGNPAQVTAIAQSLAAKSADLAAAVTANTPVAS